MLRSVLLAILLFAPAARIAVAQSTPDITGAWSGQHPVPGGTERITTSYAQDGSFVSVRQLPNGSLRRQWGVYRLAPLSPSLIRLDFQVEGWLPLRVCTEAAGFPLRCDLNLVQTAGSATLRMTGPASFQSNGTTMIRDPSPFLLQQAVPSQLVRSGGVARGCPAGRPEECAR